jgi:hypothetical protein
MASKLLLFASVAEHYIHARSLVHLIYGTDLLREPRCCRLCFAALTSAGPRLSRIMSQHHIVLSEATIGSPASECCAGRETRDLLSLLLAALPRRTKASGQPRTEMFGAIAFPAFSSAMAAATRPSSN